MKNKYIKSIGPGLLLPSILVTFPAVAASLAVTGVLETKAPTLIAVPSKPEYEAYVEPVNVVIKEGVDSGCSMTASMYDARSATNEESLLCGFEVDTPEGITKKATENILTIIGVLNEIGDVNFPTYATFFSGSADTPVDITVNDLTVKTIPPIPLTITSASSVSKQGSTEGKVVEINSPNSSNSIFFTLNTENKDYDRKITLENYGECLINKGKTTGCTISLSDFSFGSEEDRYGEVSIPVYADAKNEYFKNTEQLVKDSVTIKWDSRLPEHQKLIFGGLDFDSQHIYESESDQKKFTATKGQMIEVLKTPHFARTDDWWHLSARVQLTPKPNYKSTPDVIIRGVNYSYLWDARSNPYMTSFRSEQAIYDGEYVLLPFNTANIIDAEYTAEITITDTLYNTVVTQQDVVIENVGYEYLYFVNGQVQGSRSLAAYFPSDVNFAIWSRFRNLTLKSVTVGGKKADVTDVSGEGVHYQLASFPDGLDGEVEMVVTSEDNLGNEYVSTSKFTMQPIDFSVRNNEAYFGIQHYGVSITQEKTVGSVRECVFFTTQEEAQKANYSYDSELHCYLEWENLNDELEPRGQGMRYMLSGYTDVPNKVLKGYVHFLNNRGEQSKSSEKSIKLSSLDVPPIKLSISNGTVITGDKNQAFAVPIEGGKVAEIRADMVNADAQITAVNPFGENVVYKQSQLGTSTVYKPRSYFSVITKPGVLWEQSELLVKAGYDRVKAHDIFEKITMVYVPNKNVSTYLDSSVDTALNSEPYIFNVGVGVYNRSTKGYDYDKLTDGRWMMQLQRKQADRTYVNIGEPIETDENGRVAFNIDTSELIGSEIYRYRAVASIISDYEGYTREMNSRDISLRINKGAPVDFTLDVKKDNFKVPYKLSVSMKFDSRADSNAWEKNRWYIKNIKNSEWTLIENEDGRVIRYPFADSGQYKIKAESINAFTGVVSTLETPTLLGYKDAEYTLEYNSDEYVGIPNILKVVGEESNQLDIQWSTDGCTTFDQIGGAEFTFTRNEPQSVKLCVRVANIDTEQADDRRWSKTLKTIRIRPIEALRISSNTEKTGEVGYETELVGRVRVSSNTRHAVDASWYTPTGNKINSTIEKKNSTSYEVRAKYILTDADLLANQTQTKPFYIEGEVLGVDGTYARTDSVMDVLRYEFPEWEVDVRNDYLYAPTFATVYVSMIDQPDVKMDYTFEWLERENSTLISERSTNDKTRGYFSVNKAGLNSYAVLIRDERGNEKVVDGLGLTEEPDPASVKFKVNTSNKLMRYPLDVVVRPYVTYEHRKDRVESSKWFVDGIEVQSDDSGSGSLSHTFEKDGTYNVRFTSKSILGRVDEYQESITVIKNIFPTCEIEVRERYSNREFSADCDDEDGKIVSYQFDFPTLDVTSYTKVYILTDDKAGGETSGIIPVRLTATDDSGDSVTVEMNYEYTPKE